MVTVIRLTFCPRLSLYAGRWVGFPVLHITVTGGS
jgi:hypothetical protein